MGRFQNEEPIDPGFQDFIRDSKQDMSSLQNGTCDTKQK